MFTGRRWDEESGFYYYRARYYDCEAGRFLQSDPFGHTDGANVYVFAKSRPTKLIDPLGLSTNAGNARTRSVRGILTAGDAIEEIHKHYCRARKRKGLRKQFFGGQDIKLMQEGRMFRYGGKLLTASQVGNMAVGYTAYRLYGMEKAKSICIFGELFWPNGPIVYPFVGSKREAAKASFHDNWLGIKLAIEEERASALGICGREQWRPILWKPIPIPPSNIYRNVPPETISVQIPIVPMVEEEASAGASHIEGHIPWKPIPIPPANINQNAPLEKVNE
jgi:RHS repeat-associated protein